MRDARTLIGMMLGLSGIAACWWGLTASGSGALLPRPARFPSLHPVVAAFWAEHRCGVGPVPPDAGRFTSDDLLAMAGTFDAIEQQRGRSAACAEAARLLAPYETSKPQSYAHAPRKPVART